MIHALSQSIPKIPTFSYKIINNVTFCDKGKICYTSIEEVLEYRTKFRNLKTKMQQEVI